MVLTVRDVLENKDLEYIYSRIDSVENKPSTIVWKDSKPISLTIDGETIDLVAMAKEREEDAIILWICNDQ